MSTRRKRRMSSLSANTSSALMRDDGAANNGSCNNALGDGGGGGGADAHAASSNAVSAIVGIFIERLLGKGSAPLRAVTGPLAGVAFDAEEILRRNGVATPNY